MEGTTPFKSEYQEGLAEPADTGLGHHRNPQCMPVSSIFNEKFGNCGASMHGSVFTHESPCNMVPSFMYYLQCCKTCHIPRKAKHRHALCINLPLPPIQSLPNQNAMSTRIISLSFSLYDMCLHLNPFLFLWNALDLTFIGTSRELYFNSENAFYLFMCILFISLYQDLSV